MAVTPERQARLRQMLQELAEDDPSITELDPSDEDDAQTIELIHGVCTAVETCEPFSVILERDDGTEEELTFSPELTGPAGDLRFTLQADDLSPEGVEFAEIIFAPFHHHEVARLIGE